MNKHPNITPMATNCCQHPSWKRAGGGKDRCSLCGAIGEEHRFFQPDGASSRIYRALEAPNITPEAATPRAEAENLVVAAKRLANDMSLEAKTLGWCDAKGNPTQKSHKRYHEHKYELFDILDRLAALSTQAVPEPITTRQQASARWAVLVEEMRAIAPLLGMEAINPSNADEPKALTEQEIRDRITELQDLLP